MTELVRYNDLSEDDAIFDVVVWQSISAGIQKAETVQEAKYIKDKAAAIRDYARFRKKSLELQNAVAEAGIWAEWRMGAIIKAMKDAGDWITGRPKNGNTVLPLDSVGLTKQDSSRAQRLAVLPAAELEKYLEDTKASKHKIKITDVRRMAYEFIRRIEGDKDTELMLTDEMKEICVEAGIPEAKATMWLKMASLPKGYWLKYELFCKSERREISGIDGLRLAGIHVTDAEVKADQGPELTDAEIEEVDLHIASGADLWDWMFQKIEHEHAVIM